MGKMRVLFVLFVNIKTGAGSEKCLYYYLKYADSSRFDITVLQTDFMPGGQRLADKDLEAIRGKASFVTIHDYLTSSRLLNLNRKLRFIVSPVVLPVLFSILKVTKYKDVIKIGKFDVIYLFLNEYSYMFSPRDLVVLSNHTIFSDFHRLAPRVGAKLISLHIMHPWAKAVHLFPHNAEEGKKWLSGMPLIVLPNGVDTDVYFPRENADTVGISSEKIKILFVARLEVPKGVLMVLDVYKYLKARIPVELTIVGSGSLENEVEDLARSDIDVHYFKSISEAKLAEIYRSCDAFLYPTRADVFPLVVMEALSSGLKVVTTKLLYYAYRDFEKFNVIKFTDYDVYKLSQAFLEISKFNVDKGAVHRYIEENYSWKAVSEKLFGQLSDLAMKRRGHGFS